MIITPVQWTFGVHEGDHASYRLGSDQSLYEAIVREPFLAVDIETGKAGTERQWNVKAVSVSTPTRSWVLDPDSESAVVKDVMARGKALVFHNSPYDIPIMVQNGLASLSDIDRVHDTILLARLARPTERGGNDLGEAGNRHLGPGYKEAKTGVENYLKKITKARTKGEVFDLLGLESPAYVMYAAFDTIATARLFEVLPDAVKTHHADHPFSHKQYLTADELIERERTVMRVLLRRSAQGLLVAGDDDVSGIRLDLTRQVDSANLELARYGIDISGSDDAVRKQVMRVLDEKGALGPNWKRTNTGAPSGDKTLLEQLSDPLAAAWLQRSEASSYLNKFMDQYFLDHNGRVHPQVNVGGTITGRMSYSHPPLQQIPPVVRPMIRHDKPMVSFDWSSIEPVLFFNATKEVSLVEQFEAGGDLYMPIAETAGVKRKEAKVVLLAQLYGQGIAKLARGLGVTEDRAREIRESVRSTMPETSRAIRLIGAIGEQHGRMLTMSGRNVPIDPDPRTGNHRYYGHKAVNYFVQGSAYDLLADSIQRLHAVGGGDAVVLAIHDELVVEDWAADEAHRIMTTPPEWLVEEVGRTPVIRVGRNDLGSFWAPKED